MSILFLCLSAQAGAQVVLTDSSEHIYIGEQAAFFQDSSRVRSFEDIRMLDRRGAFVKSRQRVPNFGFTTSKPVYWIRFDIERKSDKDFILDLAFGNMAFVDFYFFGPQGLVERYKLGDFRGKAGRAVGHHGYAVKLPPWARQTVYLCIQPYSGQALFPLAVWESQLFFNANQELALVWGLYLGVLLAVLIYHLVIYWRTGEAGFGRLSLYLLFYLGFECSRGLGLGPRYLWYYSIPVINYAAYFFSTASLLAFLEFYTYVTSTKHSRPLLLTVRATQVVCVGLGLVAYFSGSIGQNQLMHYAAILGGICVMIISASAIRRGDRVGWYYLLAAASIYLGTAVQSAQRAGVFEGADGLLLRYAINIGSLIEIVLLSLGVAETVRQEKRKRREAEAQTELEVRARTKIVKEAEAEAKQQEVKRMAIELHNTVGNLLLLLRDGIAKVARSVTDNQQSQQVKDISELSKQIYERIRTLSHAYTLNTYNILQARGLDVALRELVTNQNRFGKAPHFLYRMQGSDLVLSETLQFELYNTCTELINNILKHSQATTASIMIQIKNHELILVVTDNGVGMPADIVEGYGMKQLRQRAQELNGTLHIHSRAGERCEISMILPIWMTF
ncbi:7TM diverse intracellular signaling domain-containing protein [Dyadobacter sp. CY261]|uniref:sensor histidine kinase n=1 Tax=Dyadobacter sp. CY261 TaxID=2907203 RepID=UPI001F2A37B0|nr:7TM diverse intracellular signaling domain-containing protein [Dyadobacter sp. CY261]